MTLDAPGSTPVPPPTPVTSEGFAALAARVTELEAALNALRAGALAPGPIGHAAPVDTPQPPDTLPPLVPQPLPSSVPPPPVPPATVPSFGLPPRTPPPPPGRSLEVRLGSQLFNLLGIVALIVGASWGMKLAIDHGYLGPLGRVLIGLFAGVAAILWSERFRRRNLLAFSFSLKAVGSAVLYLSIWAAFRLYDLLPAPAALVAMLLVTGWIGFMAWTQDAELLAGYALTGGFATPLLLSTGGDHETFLFTYVAAIDLATVLLVRRKPWARLLIPASLATVAYCAGYFLDFYSPLFRSHGPHPVDTQFWTTAGFTLLFFGLFALVSVRGFRGEREPAVDGPEARAEVVTPVLLPLVNAVFVGVALYAIFEASGLHESVAFVMVGLAAIFLGLMRVQRTALAAAMHLAAAIVLLTVAIPLEASGGALTTAWLVEGLVLYWASTRFTGERVRPSRTLLRFLSGAGYLLGLLSLGVHWLGFEHVRLSFLNADLAGALVALAALAGGAWIAGQRLASEDGAELPAGHAERHPIPFAFLAAIVAVGVLLISRELGATVYGPASHPAFRNADFGTALLGLGVLAGVVFAGYRAGSVLPKRFDRGLTLGALAAGTLVLFNVLALLVGTREIGALWSGTNADLERSLAISAFLMIYGGGLLAVGFRWRSAFVRWQGLLLLLFTVVKVFLVDVSGLSQGYRVASFIGLGGVLMAVSYAYQKDWLGLKVKDADVLASLPAPPPGSDGSGRSA